MSSAPSERPTPRQEPFAPYIGPDVRLREFSGRALLLGALLGLTFGASSLYLVLKVGLTVSASIPVAVLSITLFRLLSKLGIQDATILEHNIVQTTGSAGESIAFGLGVTMPAILILGFDLELARVALVAILGGLLGILMMIPLRRALIVEQHGVLRYPEGTACAEVLKAGASPESRAAAGLPPPGSGSADRAQELDARAIFSGFGIGLAYKSAMLVLKGWKDVPGHVFGPPLPAASLAAEISPELLGVGYLIGPRIASTMCAGGVLAYLVLIPLIHFFGSAVPGPLAPGAIPIGEMSPGQIRAAYVLYIGAGAVAAGGILSLLRSLPLVWRGLRAGLGSIHLGGAGRHGRARTDDELPMRLVVGGIAGLVIAIALARPLHMNLLGAALIAVFGFLFATVSSRLTGEIGSSSNPISGMTVATLLLTCGIFLLLGWTGGAWYVTALSVGGIVCIAASNAGTTSQDLKTGFLLGGTPRYQQLSILLGALLSALVLGPILLRLNAAATVYVPIREVAPAGLAADPASLSPAREALAGPQARDDSRLYHPWHKTDALGGPPGKYLVDDAGRAVYLVDPGINGSHDTRPDGTRVAKFDAPKATLMSYIIRGILDRQLPWALVLFGVMIALVLELSGIPSLAFAVGVYLPLASSSPILIGGALRWLADRRLRRALSGAGHGEAQLAAAADRSPGVLLASGYIAGGAIAGIAVAVSSGWLAAADGRMADWATRHNPFYAGPAADALALVPFAILAGLLYAVGSGRLLADAGAPGRIRRS